MATDDVQRMIVRQSSLKLALDYFIHLFPGTIQDRIDGKLSIPLASLFKQCKEIEAFVYSVNDQKKESPAQALAATPGKPLF